MFAALFLLFVSKNAFFYVTGEGGNFCKDRCIRLLELIIFVV